MLMLLDSEPETTVLTIEIRLMMLPKLMCKDRTASFSLNLPTLHLVTQGARIATHISSANTMGKV